MSLAVVLVREVMISGRSAAWLGPLSRSPAHLGLRVREEPSMKVLLSRGWSEEHTLLYVPPRREGYDLGVVVVGRNVNVGDDRPILWMFSTIGLGALEQVPRAAAQAFRRTELVLVLNNSELEDPFPTRVGIALAQEPDSLPGWDWSQVEVPPLVDWLSVTGEEVGASIKSGSTFAICDTLTFGPGNAAWTRSRLGNSVLLPCNPQMLGAGFGPFESSANLSGAIDPKTWHSEPGTERFARGFYWILPVSEPEYAKANTEGTWHAFAELVAQSQQQGRGDFELAYDLLR